MAINYTALAGEISTDPTRIGPYAPWVTEGKDAAIAAILNFVRDGVNACSVNLVIGARVAVANREGSRAEKLFGPGTFVTPNDVALALGRG